MQTIAQLTLLVRDYDEALDFYVNKLGFEKREDSPLGEGKRRVVVAPAASGCALVLAKATTGEQQARIGSQCGERVFLYLHTDDIHRDLENLRQHGISILREPTKAEFGTALVFEDLYGNKWDLVQPV
jgi:predicted enzyme related to lactoylglutathione lyase